MRIVATATFTLMLAACQPAIDPAVEGAKYVGPCQAGSFHVVELPKTHERVLARQVRPVNQEQIFHVAPGVDPFQVCQSWPFTGTRPRY